MKKKTKQKQKRQFTYSYPEVDEEISTGKKNPKKIAPKRCQRTLQEYENLLKNYDFWIEIPLKKKKQNDLG